MGCSHSLQIQFQGWQACGHTHVHFWSMAVWPALSQPIFRSLLWLQVSEWFQQVVGPPQCPPATSGAGATRSRVRAGWNVCVPGV